MDVGIRWARDNTDASWLTLGVHEDNQRAQAFYRRIGFTETGKVVPYPLDPSKKLYIMGYEDFRQSLPDGVRTMRGRRQG
jgi:ribosomal protein S18 acetylase RimI-like enzyme